MPLPSTRIDPRLVSASPRDRVAASAGAGAGAEDAGALEAGAELAAVVAGAGAAGVAGAVQALSRTRHATGATASAMRDRANIESSLPMGGPSEGDTAQVPIWIAARRNPFRG